MRNKHKCLHYYLLVNKRKWWCYLWPSKLGSFPDFLYYSWMYGHQVAWIDGHQAVMCLHYTVAEEVEKHLQLKFRICYCKTHHLTKHHCSFYHGPEIHSYGYLETRNLTVRARFIELQNEVLLERRRSQGQ